MLCWEETQIGGRGEGGEEAGGEHMDQGRDVRRLEAHGEHHVGICQGRAAGRGEPARPHRSPEDGKSYLPGRDSEKRVCCMALQFDEANTGQRISVRPGTHRSRGCCTALGGKHLRERTTVVANACGRRRAAIRTEGEAGERAGRQTERSLKAGRQEGGGEQASDGFPAASEG